ncbi:leucyl/phenylalanyl-tRNA--protein transferase [Hydrogenovibrio sp. JE_KL2]|uniref:leucyl/phenylalanyl-tRNA--protein transferase n=1 Tax=Hydrogenovibrio sp. JE_KL2 TaxID=2651188 RepID=UPI00128C2831|nr:leucyl/phenylalanyl-tRNA--protein transferase [Hydrogenovibrio sp. JE_KL2]MPQ75914.1 leucyl/phenylalanyl-tRNA--protein transferase [Hydrogenovibrio sp. JE_KL2]
MTDPQNPSQTKPRSKPITQPFWLDPFPVMFPPTNIAMTDPNGLLAVGGDLSPEWLLLAYSKGLFPWFSEDDPILWWTPNPRAVLMINNLKVSRSLKKTIRKGHFQVTLDQNFRAVMEACSLAPREGQDGTWITEDMIEAYCALHEKGHAHSVEVWQDNEIVGGLYGVSIGKVFFGESMFSKRTDASKVALVALCTQLKAWGFNMIDAQVTSNHMLSLGATEISREEFEQRLIADAQQSFPPKNWAFDIDWQSEVA